MTRTIKRKSSLYVRELSTKYKALVTLHTGTVSESIVHPREVFGAAILGNCSGIIIAHNHPSGTLTPSRQDLETTMRPVDAGKIIGIPIIDHIIIGFNSANYYSLKEEGHI